MIVVASADAALLAGWTRAVEPMGDTVTVSDAHVLGATLGHFPRVTLMVDVRMLDAQPARRLLSLLDPHPSLQVMVMADRLDEDTELALFQAGARAVCAPAADAPLLRRVVGVVQRGELWIRRALVAPLLDTLRRRAPAGAWQDASPGALVFPAEHAAAHAAAALPAMEPGMRLTHRERQIAELVGAGRSNKLIARELGITERTVKAHLTEIFRKAGVGDRVNLALRMRVDDRAVRVS